MVKILQKDSQLLRKHAEPVDLATINTPEFKKILADMHEAMESQDDAVAVAAPQIGILKRMFAVSGKIFDNFEKKETPHKDLFFINPEIIKCSKDKKIMTEGCLSVRPLWGDVERSVNASIEAYDEHLATTMDPAFQAASPAEQAAAMTVQDVTENPLRGDEGSECQARV